jgi:hypothetical protein
MNRNSCFHFSEETEAQITTAHLAHIVKKLLNTYTEKEKGRKGGREGGSLESECCHK